MPARICDRSPCDLLTRLLHVLLPKDGMESHLQIDVLIQRKTKGVNSVHTRVTLEYCPFCGTRIEPEWVDAVKGRLAL